MKRYDSYKDSGIEWIGEFPEHWELTKLKFLGDAFGGLTYSPDDVVEDEDNGILVLRSSNIQEGQLSLKDNVYVSLKISDKLTLKKGDILICSRNGSQHLIGKNICIDERMEGNTFGAFMMIYRSSYWRFLIHFFNSPIFTSQSALFLTATINQLTSNTIKNFWIAIPKSLEEQTQIAKYLDYKIAQVDKLITDKQKLIELLNEERSAMINQAVTRGLNPTVPMKDSGIDWLGEIPGHWEIKKLKYVVSKIGSGVTPKGGSEVYQESGIAFIRSQNVYFEGFKINEIAYITEEVHNSMSNSKLLSGDVLLNITGGSIGRSYYFTDEFPEANVNQHVCIIRPNANIETIYLFNLISSSIIQEQIGNCQIGGNRESVNFEQLKNFIFPLPKLDERLCIMESIKSESKRINDIIDNTNANIGLLKEYKTSLISEVVTGKVDVRSEVCDGNNVELVFPHTEFQTN